MVDKLTSISTMSAHPTLVEVDAFGGPGRRRHQDINSFVEPFHHPAFPAVAHPGAQIQHIQAQVLQVGSHVPVDKRPFNEDEHAAFAPWFTVEAESVGWRAQALVQDTLLVVKMPRITS